MVRYGPVILHLPLHHFLNVLASKSLAVYWIAHGWDGGEAMFLISFSDLAYTPIRCRQVYFP